MTNRTLIFLLISASAFAADRVTLPMGVVEGAGANAAGVREFKGVPFAAPPVGDLRWSPPAPVVKRDGVIDATKFAARCMQLPLYGDMAFRNAGMSEDCLYLNIWTPAKTGKEKLPVLVYYYGGGFQAGDGSEPRYDGESMATKGIVTVTVSYRLGIFGFLAHPELTKASPNHASGNYSLMDQSAALRWVSENIAAFGGDPKKITIAGESAGSYAVSAQMASPMSRNLFAGAISESGSLLGLQPPTTLAEGEAMGEKFMSEMGAKTLADLKKLTAQQIFDAVGKQRGGRFPVVVDGYFFTEAPAATFAAGKQAHVPYLAGWNSQEQGAGSVLGREPATVAAFKAAVERLYAKPTNGVGAADVLKEYAPANDDEVEPVARALAGDRFIAFSTWKALDSHGKTSGKPIYRYYYSRPRPKMRPEMGNVTAGLAGGVIRNEGPARPPAPAAKGAVHSAEIEYAMGNLNGNKVYAWDQDDFKVSETMQAYFVNFVKTGNPNAKVLAQWPAANKGKDVSVMHIDVTTKAEPETHRGRYLLLDKFAGYSK